MDGNPSPELPDRKKVDEEGPCPTSTPEALHWLFSRRQKDKPIPDFQPALAIMPVMYWEAWKKPLNGIAVDDCIENIIIASGQSPNNDKNNQPRRGRDGNKVKYDKRKMISRSEFTALSGKNGEFGAHDCPYAYARTRLAEAIGLAYDAVEEDKSRRKVIKNDINDTISNCIVARGAVESLLEKLSGLEGFTPRNKYTRFSQINPSLQWSGANRNDKSKLDSALDLLGRIEDRMSLRLNDISRAGRPENVWWVSFVTSCGYIWTTFTGIPVDNGHSLFEEFVCKSVESLGGTRYEFRRPIETAIEYLKDVEPWDRLDAEINGVLPPEECAVYAIDADHSRHPNIMFKAKITRLISMIKEGDTSSFRYIEYAYARADDGGKNAIIELLSENAMLGDFLGSVRVNH